MTIAELMDRIRGHLRWRIRNGAYTERGFARKAGLSQPHLHNVLNGTRALTIATADRILEGLGMGADDLIAGAAGQVLETRPVSKRAIRPAFSPLRPGAPRKPVRTWVPLESPWEQSRRH